MIGRDAEQRSTRNRAAGLRSAFWVRVGLTAVALGVGAFWPRAEAAPAVPPINDEAIMKEMPGGAYAMPERIFTAELTAGIREEKYPQFVRGNRDRAAKWLTIPEEQWGALIADFAPVSTKGTNLGVGGRCPFSGADYYRGAKMSDEEFLKTPFQARTVAGGLPIYGREQDMPVDWPQRPNRTVRIPHLDGTLREYRFFVPPGLEDAPPGYNSKRRHWFCPAGEVWRCRLQIITGKVVPDLTAAVFWKDDPKAARALAVILDRIAAVYPGLPLYTQSLGHGLARSRDGKGYLTRPEYLSIAGDRPFRSWENKPFWFKGIYDYNYEKLNGGIAGWTDGVLEHLGAMAMAFDLIRDRAEVMAFSREKYGDESGWERHVRAGYLDEAAFFALATPPTLGNTSYSYIAGAVKLGIAARNREIFATGLGIVETYLPNNWFADGMPTDAAFNYAMMTFAIIRYRWMNKLFGGLDLTERYPILEIVDRLGPRALLTLYNIGSKHADQHARFYRSRRPWMPPPQPEAIPYEEHEASQCFPIYGLTCLRGGRPGSRLEMILDHQNTSNHAHFSKLNIQLFYEGVELLPDFGYCVGCVDPAAAPWRNVKVGYELLGTPDPRDKWAPWRHHYSQYPEAHCVAMVDHWLYAAVPTRLHRFLGGGRLAEPGSWAQFVDASARGLFAERPNPVDVFRRQVLVLTLPGGRPVVVDVFRIRGGQRHDLFWHVPSDPPETTLGPSEPIQAPNLQQYLDLKPNYDKLTGEPTRHFARPTRLIENLKRHAAPPSVWQARFLIQPSRVVPESEVHRKQYGGWPQLLHDVNLRLWGAASGSPTEQAELLSARGPWPGWLEVFDPDTGRNIENQLVGLKDSIHFLIRSRRAAAPGLESTFVHVLEPWNPGQAPAVSGVEVLDQRPLGEGGAVACRLSRADGGEAFAATTLNGEAYDGSQVKLHGRLGAACPDAGCLVLFDGVSFAAGGWGVELEPSWNASLAGVVGDLTGAPRESALIVASERPLPEDAALAGRMLCVNHRAGRDFSTSYTIERVSRYGPGLWRIDLRNTPPFIQHRMRIWKIDQEDPSLLYQDFRFYKGAGKINYEGRRVRFLRSHWEGAMEFGTWANLKLKEAPPSGAVQPGDAFIIFTVQPGDEVTIPAHFACRGERLPGAMKLDIVSTGPALLRLPERPWRTASIGKDGQKADKAVEIKDGALRIELGAADLHNGRAVLTLAE